MIVKSSSTGKSKVKRTQLTRMTDCLTCPKLMEKDVHKKDYEKPQPIKIAQFLEQSENLKSVQKDNDVSVRKRIQPERLGSSSSTKVDYERPQPIKIAQLLGQSENQKSVQKNSVRRRVQPERLSPSSNIKSTKKSDKKNGASTYGRSVNVLKCVRRNLNFNEFPSDTLRNNYDKKNQPNKCTTNAPVYKKCSDSMRKRSLLLPPNTIKDKHLQKCTEKISRKSKIPEIPNEMLMDTKETVPKEHKKSEAPSILPPNNKSSCINNFAVPFDGTLPSSRHTIVTSSGYQNSKRVNTNDVRSDAAKSEEESEYVKSLCSNLQNTKLVDSENHTNAKSASSETICVNKDKIMSLECDLKNLLSVTEENVFKLKSVLTYITKLLSENDGRTALSDAKVEEKHTKPERVNNTMVDKEVQVNTYCNLIQQMENNLKTPVVYSPQINVTNILSVNANQSIQNTEYDKENYEFIHRRRPSDGDGSFLELENQLNIKHTKTVQNPISLQKTPVVTRYKQKRSLREYMALKSTMKFLETPDGKRFKQPLCEIDNMDKSVLNATYISNKILTDLHNLYAESPESSL